jgi:hypothetical protein
MLKKQIIVTFKTSKTVSISFRTCMFFTGNFEIINATGSGGK